MFNTIRTNYNGSAKANGIQIKKYIVDNLDLDSLSKLTGNKYEIYKVIYKSYNKLGLMNWGLYKDNKFTSIIQKFSSYRYNRDKDILNKDISEVIVETCTDSQVFVIYYFKGKQYIPDVDTLDNLYGTKIHLKLALQIKNIKNYNINIPKVNYVVSEYPISNKIKDGIIDCIILKDNKYYIVDWKTGKFHTEYTNQLYRYKSYIENSFSIKIEGCYVIFIEEDKYRPIKVI